MELCIRNVGPGATDYLEGTLMASGGVAAPSGPQDSAALRPASASAAPTPSV